MTAAILNASGFDVGLSAQMTCSAGQQIRGYETVDRHQAQVTFHRVWEG